MVFYKLVSTRGDDATCGALCICVSLEVARFLLAIPLVHAATRNRIVSHSRNQGVPPPTPISYHMLSVDMRD